MDNKVSIIEFIICALIVFGLWSIHIISRIGELDKENISEWLNTTNHSKVFKLGN